MLQIREFRCGHEPFSIRSAKTITSVSWLLLLLPTGPVVRPRFVYVPQLKLFSFCQLSRKPDWAHLCRPSRKYSRLRLRDEVRFQVARVHAEAV
jgi:hypothetical protein